MSDTDGGTYDIAYARIGLISHPTNNIETFLNFLKGLMGSGVLAMPYAYKYAGLVGGIFGTMFATGIAGYGIHLLVKSSHELYRRLRVPYLSYAEVTQKTFEIGPKSLRIFARSGAIITDLLLCIDLLGCCAAYVVFVAEALSQLVYEYQPDIKNYFGIRSFIAFLLIPHLLITLIRFLKYLAYVSMTALSLILIGCGCAIYYVIRPPINSLSSQPFVAPITDFPMFFCITLFAIECMGVVMSLENAMKDPTRMTTMPGIICGSFTFGCLFYGTVGFIGFLKYGNETAANIVLNIPHDDIVSLIAKFTIALGIFLTYALQFYVPIEIMIRHLEASYGTLKLKWIICLRELVCAIVVLVAWLLPTIGGLMAVLGAVACSVLGIIFPATFYLILFHDNPNGFVFGYIVGFTMIFIGLFALIAGTFISVIEIIKDLWPHLLE